MSKIVICDKCGAQGNLKKEVDLTTFSHMIRFRPPEEWYEVGKKDLCPRCGKEFFKHRKDCVKKVNKVFWGD